MPPLRAKVERSKKINTKISRLTPHLSLLTLAACGGDDKSPGVDTGNSEGYNAFTFSVDERQSNNFTPMSAPISIDLDSDGQKETILSFNGYPEFPELEWLVLGGDNNVQNLSSTLFKTDISTQQTRQIFQVDIDQDGDLDVIAGDVGFDLPPWTGGGIYALLNEGGIYTDITPLLPSGASTVRAYAIAAGNLDNDENIEVIVPDTNNAMGFGTKGLAIEITNIDGEIIFTPEESPLSTLDWEYENASVLTIQDIDGDGVNDLFIGGNWIEPNNTIYYSGFLATERSLLPESTYGHYSGQYSNIGEEIVTGADVNVVLFYDYDNDGDTDIITFAEEVNVNSIDGSVNVAYNSTELQVLEQTDTRTFENDDLYIDLGYRYYGSAENVDVNNDGLMDFVGHYFVKGVDGSIAPWGSSVFLNQGNLEFIQVDSVDFVNAKSTSEYGTITIASKNADNSYKAIISEPKLDGFHEVTDTYLVAQFVDISADLSTVQIIA